VQGGAIERWALRLVRCPRCGGVLHPGAHLVRCEACGPYPVLGGVPVLVIDPAAWCARFHDAALAALAEHGEADREAVSVVEAFAEGRDLPREPFGDDWTRHERAGAEAPRWSRGPAARALRTLAALERTGGPGAFIERRARQAAVVLEVGCGAGLRSSALARRARSLILGDLSLRAVLAARRRAAQGEADVVGVVLDAEALPLRRASVDLVVAEHVVDLLEEPGAFFASARAAVRRGGRLLLTTPEPALGTDDDGAAAALAWQAGFAVKARLDGLPWLRLNSPRFIETYLVQALELVAR
jgi:SAM-dependent methyltransferase